MKLDVETTLLEIAEALDKFCKVYEAASSYPDDQEIGNYASYSLSDTAIVVDFGWNDYEEYSNQILKINVSGGEIIVVDENNFCSVMTDEVGPTTTTHLFKSVEDVISYLSSEVG